MRHKGGTLLSPYSFYLALRFTTISRLMIIILTNKIIRLRWSEECHHVVCGRDQGGMWASERGGKSVTWNFVFIPLDDGPFIVVSYSRRPRMWREDVASSLSLFYFVLNKPRVVMLCLWPQSGCMWADAWFFVFILLDDDSTIAMFYLRRRQSDMRAREGERKW